jgi:hypothetical protein
VLTSCIGHNAAVTVIVVKPLRQVRELQRVNAELFAARDAQVAKEARAAHLHHQQQQQQQHVSKHCALITYTLCYYIYYSTSFADVASAYKRRV